MCQLFLFCIIELCNAIQRGISQNILVHMKHPFLKLSSSLERLACWLWFFPSCLHHCVYAQMLHITNNPNRSVCLLMGMHTHTADKESLQSSFTKMSRWCNCSNTSWGCFACAKTLSKAPFGIFLQLHSQSSGVNKLLGVSSNQKVIFGILHVIPFASTQGGYGIIEKQSWEANIIGLWNTTIMRKGYKN